MNYAVRAVNGDGPKCISCGLPSRLRVCLALRVQAEEGIFLCQFCTAAAVEMYTGKLTTTTAAFSSPDPEKAQSAC